MILFIQFMLIQNAFGIGNFLLRYFSSLINFYLYAIDARALTHLIAYKLYRMDEAQWKRR